MHTLASDNYKISAYSPVHAAQQPVDEVAEWLRRWTANPLGSARVGSNPIFVEFFFKVGYKCGGYAYRLAITNNLGIQLKYIITSRPTHVS